MDILTAARAAKSASRNMAAMKSADKNKALEWIAAELKNRAAEIFAANKIDVQEAEMSGLPSPLLKRLFFGEEKLADVIDGINSLIGLEDPVGKKLMGTELDEGLNLYRVSCPIGVIGMIFESRPDALVQISTLALKSGNAVLLKGGSEAKHTNRILKEIIAEATIKADVSEGWIQLLENRDEVKALLKMDEYVDLIIPRGSNEFVKYIMDNSNIAVMGHADGICHCYVDEFADIEMALRVVTDAKTQYVAVCNATETLLVHAGIASEFLPKLQQLMKEKHVEIVGCAETQKIINVLAASEEDWKTEYLDYKLSIKIVKDIDEAIAHINTYGSGHTDAIITGDAGRAEKFMELVDTANAYWNCSTRFADGYRYGFGAEVGISTNKLHARGPVGLDGLVSYKYKLYGNGQIVADYAEKRCKFTHKKLF